MDAVIEITQHGASVTYVMRGPSVSPWHVTPDARQQQVESSREPESVRICDDGSPRRSPGRRAVTRHPSTTTVPWLLGGSTSFHVHEGLYVVEEPSFFSWWRHVPEPAPLTVKRSESVMTDPHGEVPGGELSLGIPVPAAAVICAIPSYMMVIWSDSSTVFVPSEF